MCVFTLLSYITMSLHVLHQSFFLFQFCDNNYLFVTFFSPLSFPFNLSDNFLFLPLVYVQVILEFVSYRWNSATLLLQQQFTVHSLRDHTSRSCWDDSFYILLAGNKTWRCFKQEKFMGESWWHISLWKRWEGTYSCQSLLILTDELSDYGVFPQWPAKCEHNRFRDFFFFG